ncbi:RidA family protein [Kitasatospora sp. NBC_01266]|uniref:RidA family protein n=1 Tax=Kitasatospora sp. NBC_01266 TaxID=2903572 RepID=UPI002E379316|nr:RidA family protein [Kitasatospora sp. NBC_01266]
MPVDARLTEVPDLAPGPGYAHAVVTSGRLAFVSGQVAIDGDGELVGAGDVAAQARQAMRNLRAVLRELGADWDNVVRFGWYLLDVGEVQAIRDARDEFIRPVLGEQANPASTLVEVSSLFRPGFLVEVDAVVALP